MNTIENLRNYRAKKRLTITQMSNLMGVSSQLYTMYENGKRNPKDVFWLKFEELQNGTSETHETPEPYGNVTHAPVGKFPKKVGIAYKPVPYFDVDFTAGDIEVYDDHNAIQPAYMMDIPEFSGCTAFRVFSNSMERLIVSGSILFGTKVIDWADHLEYGQIYGIVCHDKRRYLKYIRKATQKEETHFLLKSENTEEFDDFLMPKSKIKSIWLIHGWLNKRA